MSRLCMFLLLIASFSVLETQPSLCIRFENSSALSLLVLKALTDKSFLLFLAFYRQIQQMECVRHKILLDFLVERRVGAKATQVVHLDKPGLQIRVNHDIEAQDLKTA